VARKSLTPTRTVVGQGTTSASLTPGSFTATVSAITSAFGDPTRRAVYLFAREHPEGLTAAQIADEFEVHPNVARHHLDKLAAGGYLEVAIAHHKGAGAGRPSKQYRAVNESPHLEFPVRSDDLVLSLLGKALTLLAPQDAEAMAEEVGQQYGQIMAAGLTGPGIADGGVSVGHRSLRSALQTVADALTAHGFAAHTDQRNNQLRIVNNHCPFGDVAIEHPVICAVDRGMVKGMLTAIYGDTSPEMSASLPQGDTFCATTV
jgi:predicted ArsR family transcriptional regulator